MKERLAINATFALGAVVGFSADSLTLGSGAWWGVVLCTGFALAVLTRLVLPATEKEGK